MKETFRLSDRFLKGCYCHQLFDLLQAGICITDSDGTIRFINSSYVKSFKMDPDKVIGKNITEFFPDSALINVMHSGLADRRVPFEWEGTKSFISRFPIYDDGNIVGGLIEVHARDIDELERLLRGMQNLQKKMTHYKNKTQLLGAEYSFKDIMGTSMALCTLREQGSKFALGNDPILITGESGTGKELLAHALHAASLRSNEVLIRVNCAAIPSELIEAELFGYEEGAFTGSRKGGRIGMFELADGGTIFLDEIGELPPITQAKLLRVLEKNEIQKLGRSEYIYSDFRIIAVTNRNLQEMVQKGQFRADLYHRLNILHLQIPPLRERPEDIPLLVRHFLQSFKIDVREKEREISCSDSAYQLLCRYSWPGNVRELKNVLTFARYSMNVDCNTLEVCHLPPHLQEKGHPEVSSSSARNKLRNLSKEDIVAVLERCNGNKSKAARELGISRTDLYNKLKKYFTSIGRG